VGNFEPQATDPILANDADLREVAAGLAGSGFFNSVVDGGSFDAHVFTVESLEDFRCEKQSVCRPHRQL
jgi:hypothetical protein